MNIRNILKLKYKSWTTKDKDVPEWVKERRQICESCPLNSKHTKLKEKDFRWWKWWILNLFKNFCTDCTCSIFPKSMGEMESCPKGKWKSIL